MTQRRNDVLMTERENFLFIIVGKKEFTLNTFLFDIKNAKN